MDVDAECDHLSSKFLDLFGCERNGLEESEVLAHTPSLVAFLMLIPSYQMRGCFYVLGDRLLAQNVLSGLDCFFDHGWLNANRQGYDHGINVFAGEEMVKGMAGCGGRVIVCLDGLRRAFGKFVGGRFGTRVDGFEGEARVCLNCWEVLCVEGTHLAPAIMMSRKGAQTLSCKDSSSNDGYSD